jgi:hypothetical protein
MKDKHQAMNFLQKRIVNRIRKSKEYFYYFIERLKRQDRNTTKIFCIGRNKTGTTSLASFFRVNGYKVGNQEQAELLMEDWARRDFTRIIEYCKTAEVFQDLPFSLPYTYETLDLAFPNSKFILTFRTTPEEWYNSLITHHTKQMSSTSNMPSEEDLKNYKYRGKYKGWVLFNQKVVYGYPAVPLYDKTAYMAHYEQHNARVMEYFKDRPGDLLALNLKDPDAFERLCHHVGLNPAAARPIPHLNQGAAR